MVRLGIFTGVMDIYGPLFYGRSSCGASHRGVPTASFTMPRRARFKVQMETKGPSVTWRKRGAETTGLGTGRGPVAVGSPFSVRPVE